MNQPTAPHAPTQPAAAINEQDMVIHLGKQKGHGITIQRDENHHISVKHNESRGELSFRASQLGIHILGKDVDGGITATVAESDQPIRFTNEAQLQDFAGFHVALALPEYKTVEFKAGSAIGTLEDGTQHQLSGEFLTERLNILDQQTKQAQADGAQKWAAEAAKQPIHHPTTEAHIPKTPVSSVEMPDGHQMHATPEGNIVSGAAAFTAPPATPQEHAAPTHHPAHVLGSREIAEQAMQSPPSTDTPEIAASNTMIAGGGVMAGGQKKTETHKATVEHTVSTEEAGILAGMAGMQHEQAAVEVSPQQMQPEGVVQPKPVLGKFTGNPAITERTGMAHGFSPN